MTTNCLRPAAIAALALAGAADAQETDSDVASTGEQVFRRFASLCRDQKAACDAAFRFGALVGPTRPCGALSPTTVSLASRRTMNSQEFMEEERKAITGRRIPNNESECALVALKSASSYARRREGGYGPPFCLEERNTEIDGGFKGSALTLARFPRRRLWTRNM